ncbi:MAG TPA: TVP38/TMEM64 family protein [Pirellulales bacterium]|jgi:uncharacterized membrane protein YdjX (TVP38/TMEM64 family)|nr:TVP38/TMEM64 family protein [Pirellulales bacterium]
METTATPDSGWDNRQAGRENGPRLGWRPIAFGIVALAIVMVYAWFHRDLSLHGLAEREDDLRRFQQAHSLLLPAIVFAIFVAAAGLSLPVGIILSVGCGWLFGPWEAGVLVSFASTAGATLAFWISRYLLRDAISHRVDHLMKSVDELVDRDGAFYLLSLRLVHIVPSWLINLLMGWTTMRTATFWWATQVGTLPATILYVCVGEQFKSLRSLAKEGGISSLLTPGRVAIFVLLAILPLAARQAIKEIQRQADKARSGKTKRQDDGGAPN